MTRTGHPIHSAGHHGGATACKNASPPGKDEKARPAPRVMLGGSECLGGRVSRRRVDASGCGAAARGTSFGQTIRFGRAHGPAELDKALRLPDVPCVRAPLSQGKPPPAQAPSYRGSPVGVKNLSSGL